MLPTLVLTFDQDVSTNAFSVAFPVMNPTPSFAGGPIPATLYLKPANIDAPGYFTWDNIVILKMLGWEIGVYLPYDMPAVWAASRGNAFDIIKTAGDALEARGLAPATIAPGGRLWNKFLGNMARGRFKGVRIPQGYVWPQPYPIADPLSGVSGGGAASWGMNDTAASILARADALIAAGPGNMAIEVIHNVGPVADSHTISTPVFEEVIDGYAQRRDAGLMRIAPLDRALTP